MKRINNVGLKAWLQEQNEKRDTLEGLLANYNEGRSMSFYCVAAALMPIDLMRQALNEAQTMLANNNVDDLDIKTKAKILKSVIRNLASKSGIDLKLRKKPKKGSEQK